MKNESLGRREFVDTGMALTLICLLLGLGLREHGWFVAAIVLLVIDMTAPTLYKLPAKVWFAFSHLLGTVMSKVILSVVFFGLVTPLALVRRLSGHDLMNLRGWKKQGSVFVTRDHTYTAKELEHPF